MVLPTNILYSKTQFTTTDYDALSQIGVEIT